MLNKAPIFVNSFSRGGSNILINLLLSHPGVCHPSGETQMVFLGGDRGESRPRIRLKRWCYGYPLEPLSGSRSLFDQNDLSPRPELSCLARRYVDRVLYRERFAARSERHNRFVREGIAYTDEEIAQARLLSKNVDGLVFMTDNFATMYPDAIFFGLIRNGFALCEGHVRRGRKAQDFAQFYRVLAEKMLKDADELEHYHIVRFEDVLRDPIRLTRSLYQHAGLNFDEVDQVRLQLKPTLTRSGEHRLDHGLDRQVVWYAKDQVAAHL